MYVGMARLSLMLTGAHSLKDKRMVIRRIKDRVRERVGVFVSEVGSPEVKDSWQRGELGVAVVSGDRQKALALIDDVIRVAMSAGGAEIGAIAKDVITFEAAAEPLDLADHAIDPSGERFGPGSDERTGSADKAVGGDDWVPDAWREDA